MRVQRAARAFPDGAARAVKSALRASRVPRAHQAPLEDKARRARKALTVATEWRYTF